MTTAATSDGMSPHLSTKRRLLIVSLSETCRTREFIILFSTNNPHNWGAIKKRKMSCDVHGPDVDRKQTEKKQNIELW